LPRRRDDEPSEERDATAGSVSADVAEALRALSEQVGELRQELESLRLEQAALPPPAGEAAGWEQRPVLASSGPTWTRSLDSPSPRRPAVPRLALEIAFLAAVAAAAALARLDPAAVVGVVAVAWALVAVLEWLAWRSARREEELLAGIALDGARVESDLSWFTPPLEQTAELADQPTRTPKLPPAQLE
jgi:hypothetical protein